ncbi:MAG: nitronate monooxygenase [Chloroflexota bacterium]|nr:nitronate monooxygenase [Chloroflexota bacterium]PLS80720.1 MAG: 2-nitropropane dioxygenase [Chloroflexota bacterium]
MLHTRICDLLAIEHPIISAPMTGRATAELVAAVSAAGGFGLIGGSTGGPEWLREQIRMVRERTDRPFGVGFISSAPGLQALVQVALEERVAAISHSFADPTPYVQAAHAVGVKVLAQVQTVAGAVAAARAGVDVITAQGTEAGGHTGYNGTLPFVPAVIDVAGGIPVVAAGGIADGRGLAAVLMLGAEGAWIGTRFLASREAGGAAWAKTRVVQAGADDTILTQAYDLAQNAPFPADVGGRVLRNAFTARWHGLDDEVVARQQELEAQVLAAEAADDARNAPVYAGNDVGLISSIEPAAKIMHKLVLEAEQILRERPAKLLR